MCPQCGREAPLIYRGALAYCSACNAPRVPLSATGLNLAGKPAKVGGTVAAVVGWVVLALSLMIALGVGALLQALLPPAGWILGGLIAAVGIGAAVLLITGGRFLQRTGDKAATGARKEAVFALAQNQKGILRAPMVGKALGITPVEAEAFLTDLSRDPDSGVKLEVDADGLLYFQFPEFAPELPWPPPGMAGATGPFAAAPGAVRVARTELRAPVTQPGAPLLDDEPVDDVAEDGVKRARQGL